MGRLIYRYSAYFAVILSIVLACATVISAYQLYQQADDYRLVQSQSPITINDNRSAQLIFARARQLESKQKIKQALQLYNSLEQTQDPLLYEHVQYNMGVLYLRQAARQWNREGARGYARINPLLDLAEHAFRKVLMANPEHWDARYNLEYALRIRPPAKQVDKGDWTGHKASVHAVLPGIPGGGP